MDRGEHRPEVGASTRLLSPAVWGRSWESGQGQWALTWAPFTESHRALYKGPRASFAKTLSVASGAPEARAPASPSEDVFGANSTVGTYETWKSLRALPPTHLPCHSPAPVSSAVRCFPQPPSGFSLAGMFYRSTAGSRCAGGQRPSAVQGEAGGVSLRGLLSEPPHPPHSRPVNSHGACQVILAPRFFMPWRRAQMK